jgi:GxxExxY protein
MPLTSSRPALAHAEITSLIIAAFYAVYDELGFGFLEAVYCNALAFEFKQRGLSFTREAPIEVFYKGMKAGHYRADFLVEGLIVVEVKATALLTDAHRAQTLNCLRGSRTELALLLHFGPKAAFKRLFHENSRKRGLPDTATPEPHPTACE